MSSNIHLNTLPRTFSNMLSMHANLPACWYNIQHYSSQGGQNLSSYLGLDRGEYLEMLLLLGLAKKHGKTLRMQRGEWKKLEDLSSVTSCPLTVTQFYHKECQKMLWICLGGACQDKAIRFHPGNQPENVKTFSYQQLERKYLEVGDIGERSKMIYSIEKLVEVENTEREANDEAEINVNGEGGREGGGDIDVRFEDGEEEGTIEIDSSRYPYLDKNNPSQIKPSHIYCLLRDIVRLSKDHEKDFKLQYQLISGATRELIIVPKVSTEASFQKCAKPVLEKMTDGFVSDSLCKKRARAEGLSIETVRMEEKKAITRQIIEHYCVSHPDILKDVANDHGFDFENKTMDKHYAAAMFCESGIGPGKSRIINRYLTAFFNRRLMVSETEIFRDKDLALDELPPEVRVHTMPDKTKLNYYVKPLDKIISLGLKKKIKQLKSGDEEKIDRVDISWSADHGGGFFRAIVKCVAKIDMKTLSFSHRVGQMQCKSDKYDTVYSTMGKYLNKGIKSLLENDGKTPKSLNIYSTGNINGDNLNFYIMPQGLNDIHDVDDRYRFHARVHSNQIKIAITGDMAFYATNSCWCTWCNASSKEWATTETVKGAIWNRAYLKRKLLQIREDPKMNANEKKGVKEKPILDCDPSLFVPPPLHLKLGLVNRAFIKSDGYSYFSWSQKRIENLPQAERVAFHLYQESIKDFIDRNEDAVLFELQNPKEGLVHLKETKIQKQAELKQRGLTDEVRATLEQDLACIEHEITKFQTESKAVKANLKEAKQRRTQAKKEYESEKKKRTYHSRFIQNQKENVLKDLGIDRGASHGGDLQGRGCTNLLQRAHEFFEKCREIDLKAVEEGTALASREEVEQVNRHFKQLAVIMDKLFHYINMTHEQVEAYNGDDFLSELENHVHTFVWLWNYLRLSLLQPKFHTVEDHLVDAFWLWHAIGPYNEEFTESDHVKGNAESRIFGALRDTQSREEAVSKRAAIMENPEVQVHIDNFNQKGKRKRMSDSQSVSIKRRREEVLEEVHALKEQMQNSGKKQISDYWNQSTA